MGRGGLPPLPIVPDRSAEARSLLMKPDRPLCAVIESPMDRWEKILRDAITPAVRALRSQPQLRNLSWGRFNKPTWQLQLWVFGPSEWLTAEVRPLLHRRLAPLVEARLVRAVTFGDEQPEME